ncbi:MAG: hypothetical protein MUQ30_03165 [Anaerolineae bacterium]|nr:hypothetical protein [Anaerolineae bacterium]
MATLALLEDLLRTIFSYLIVIVEACGGLVIAIGVSRAIVGYVRTFGMGRGTGNHTCLRIALGRAWCWRWNSRSLRIF